MNIKNHNDKRNLAFIPFSKVNDIVHHLNDGGFENMTISSAEGTGKFQDEDAFVSQKFSITDSEVAQLELVVNSADLEKVVHIISEQGKTLNPGDGLIYVSAVDQISRIKRRIKKWRLNTKNVLSVLS